MKEKVLYVKLSEIVKFRGSKSNRGGMIGTTCQVKKETKAKFKIPKPKPLIGGSKVYHNYGVPYWYCKIKNGRDEFMYLYIEDLTEMDLLYDSKTKIKRKFSTSNQKMFRALVLDALSNKPKKGCWIPVFEPSSDGKGGLQFVKGEKPLVELNCIEWSKKMKEYSPANESGGSSATTYYLLLLRWLKDGFATLEQLTEHSEEIGHYYDSENSKDGLEKTGERNFGGLYGFVGNTKKMVKLSNAERKKWFPEYDASYLVLGGNYMDYGKNDPVAYSGIYLSLDDYIEENCIGLLELKK